MAAMTKAQMEARIKRLVAEIRELEAHDQPGAADVIAAKLAMVQWWLGEGQRLGL